jgi:hypothetical protein
MVIAGVATVAGSALSNRGADKAADASRDANLAAIDEQRRQYDTTRDDYMPFLEAGYGALDRQNAFLSGDWSGFESSPDYKFAVDQGFKGLERGLSAGGAMGSGGADADRIALGQGLATQYAGNYWNKLAGQAGQGQAAVGTLGSLGANAANQIGGAYQNIGNARASSFQQKGQNYSDLAYGLGGGLNNWYQGNKANNPGGTGWYLGNQPGKG